MPAATSPRCSLPPARRTWHWPAPSSQCFAARIFCNMFTSVSVRGLQPLARTKATLLVTPSGVLASLTVVLIARVLLDEIRAAHHMARTRMIVAFVGASRGAGGPWRRRPRRRPWRPAPMAVKLVGVPAGGLGEVLDGLDVRGAPRGVLGLVAVEDPHGAGSQEKVELSVAR